MTKIINQILKYKKTILSIFLISFILCLFSSSWIKVNYNMMDYLPSDSKSTKALDIMEKEYDSNVSNMRIMMKDVSLTEALFYKKKIEKVKGVNEINFLDDIVSLDTPLEIIPKNVKEEWYKDKNALFTLTIDEREQHEAVASIKEIIKDKGVVEGTVVNTVDAENATAEELRVIFMFVIPLILIILLLTTSSYFEPILFLITIGFAIILNMGTNIFLKEISFVTKAASSILQLAVSMDYSIFLLHRFADFRKDGYEVVEAMKLAVKKSFSSILSSGLTTVVGFAALILMNFRIGPDMGIVMAKSIFFSLLCVIVLLPILGVYSYKIIDKTAHKSFMPSFEKFGKFTQKIRIPLCIIFIILIIPCYLGSIHNDFIYGSSKILGDETETGKERNEIQKEFGKSNQLVLMVPKGNFAKEKLMTDEIEKLEGVNSIISYVTSVGTTIPVEYAPSDKVAKLISKNYSRMVISVDIEEESQTTFEFIDKLNTIANHYYKDEYHLAGTSVSTYDLKQVVTEDNKRVNSVAIIAIAIILLVTFKSISLPFILLLVIETSIWINLTYAYFKGLEMSYIAYLIISSIQLGATIDYAILFTDEYLTNRKSMTKEKAAIRTVANTFISILTSSSILTICGFILGKFSSNGVISELGYLIGRGALISTILVIFVLPGLLNFFDKGIERTTRGVNFYHRKEKMKMKKQNHKAKMAMLATLLISTLVNTNIVIASDINNIKKEENVYANLSFDGVIKGIYIVNEFQLDKEEKLCDYGNYSSVRNLSTVEELNYENNKACINISDKKFSYQGNLEKKELPWDLSISYYLNGKKINAEDIVGQKGNLEIHLNIHQNRNVDKFFFENYLLQATISFDAINTKNIDAKGAMIANVGGTKQIKYNILAGNEKDIIIKADVENFEMDAISINAIPMKMDITIDNLDELISQVKDLQFAINTINNGSKKIDIATTKVKKGASELESGAKKMKEGLNLLNEQSNKLLSSSDNILIALKKIDENTKKLYQLNNRQSVKQLISEIEKVDIDTTNNNPYNEYIAGVKQLLQIYQTNKQYVDAIYNSNLYSNYQKFDKGLEQYIKATQNIISGYDKIYQGIDSLTKGLEELKKGTSNLSKGTNQLRNNTLNMDKKINQTIEDMQEKFNNENFKAKSFTSDKNQNVSNVQFVIQTEKLTKKEENKKIEPIQKDKSFIGKIRNLFN